MSYQPKPQVLIVDDDENICKTLSAILRSEGYETATATTGTEALRKAKNQFYNVALLDIRLPDIEGIELLAQLQKMTPETVKIMLTGYPSLKNAVDALNLGADSYLMKPIDPLELLKAIDERLQLQKQTEETTREKLAKWLQLQAHKMRTSNFQDFLEEAAHEMTSFGITMNQAKIYIALMASGVASTSEIAKLSRVRREEVYRMMPELEKRGIVVRKLEKPRKFTAVQPQTGVRILAKNKLENMKLEIDELQRKQSDLIAKLRTMTLSTEEKGHAIEVISQQDVIFEKLKEMTGSAKQKMDMVAPLETLRFMQMSHSKRLVKRMLSSIGMRIITENCGCDAIALRNIPGGRTTTGQIELRCLKEIPFSILIVDSREALWGTRSQRTDKRPQMYWANDRTQISVLQASFEKLWLESFPMEKSRLLSDES